MSFPNPQTHNFPNWIRHGDDLFYGRDVVSFGDELTVENLREAYRNGIFPWFMKSIPLPWYCPAKRAILDFSRLHVPRSLAKEQRRSKLTFTVDRAFTEVMKACSQSFRPGQDGTWITDEFIEVYSALHREGMAHSVEAWSPAGELVGGLYGVDSGGVFCGESMFFIEPNASKLALLFLIGRMKERGATWMDIQVMTPHMRALGATEISRADFMSKLRETQQMNLNLF
ncbi:MAG: leucyl/phenylalanyl-tRNA--protein transferase [Pyrinomonadaceae bacterium]|nr:leucyl/phenylalanyl-tRNA--protein transferase [Pyrinomonadaceae bacterium]